MEITFLSNFSSVSPVVDAAKSATNDACLTDYLTVSLFSLFSYSH